MIVLDSAAAVEYLAGLEHGPWVKSLLADDSDVHTPHLLDIEVVSALRGLATGGKLSQRAARDALDDFVDFPVQRYPHRLFLARVWQLRNHVSAYDAVYIALAEALDAQLVTTDQRLARTRGHRARIVAPE